MCKRSQNTLKMARAAIIAALYVLLTVIFQPISFGGMQARVSEALCMLPVMFCEAVPGLAVGCLLANLLCGANIIDIIFGTLATLIAAYLTRLFNKKILVAAIFPVIVNAVISGAVVYFCYIKGSDPFDIKALATTGAFVGIGEAAVMYILGCPLIKLIKRLPIKNHRP